VQIYNNNFTPFLCYEIFDQLVISFCYVIELVKILTNLGKLRTFFTNTGMKTKLQKKMREREREIIALVKKFGRKTSANVLVY
jgi:hypothetical protein